VERQTYTFDAAGNRKTMTLLNADRITYSYDKANQLIGEQRTGGLAYQAGYSYDPAGNRTQLVKNGVTTTYTYDAANQLTSRAVPARRLTRMTMPEYGQRDARRAKRPPTPMTLPGELTAVNGPGVAAAYQYDAFDRRVSETTNGGDKLVSCMTR